MTDEMSVGVVVHEPSAAGARVAHQTHSTSVWDLALVPSAAGRTNRPERDCPVEVALTALSGRWTTLVLRDSMHGPRSYSELRMGLPSLSDKVLSDRLAQLLDRGLVERWQETGFPTRTRYSLTPLGHQLRPLLIELYRTGQQLQGQPR